ncbi:MAG: hypothetical protein WCW93_01095 [Candidatus Paceibacterota bacterium]
MRQATLQLKTRIQNVNIMNNNIEVEKNIFNTMLLVLAALALFYVLILGNMVFNIVERKTLEKEMLTLNNEVGELEVSYLAVSNSIDTNLSSIMGFKETKATFATRKSLGFNSNGSNFGNVKLANNEI